MVSTTNTSKSDEIKHSGATVQKAGKLVICPTPLGNLGDMTQRACEALEHADVVCAEDTRVTGKLLSALGIKKRLERLDETLLAQRAELMAERVCAGEVIAYCSDAGMPGVSDPGMRLVKAVREAGGVVEVLPGPVAAATAYVASGTQNTTFYFGGFFPRKDTQRQVLLQSLAPLEAALIFYESPKRVVRALEVLAHTFPLREAAVCRELTKVHEEIVRMPLPELAQEFAKREQSGQIKGEIVIVVDGPSLAEDDAAAACAQQDAREVAAQLRACGMRKKDIAKQLVEQFGISRNDAYAIALEDAL
ncbi:16S rRNA (cytidine(1402)-2'-O)-methyltransferase [Eggerthellaceae bacterium 3-80]